MIESPMIATKRLSKMYGQEIETQIATEIMVDLAEQFGMRVRGKKQIILARKR